MKLALTRALSVLLVAVMWAGVNFLFWRSARATGGLHHASPGRSAPPPIRLDLSRFAWVRLAAADRTIHDR
jgi:hypothetical protein